MPDKIKLILNPVANHGRAEQIASALRPLLDGQAADWSVTEYPGHAVELARDAGTRGFELVVALGGDGTAHEVINGLMQVPTKKRPALGIVPLGSGNDFAYSLGVAQDPSKALGACLTGQPHPLDVGSLRDENGRLEYFDNTLGIGFDAVVTIRSRKITAVHGFMMYLIATLQTIFQNFTPMDLRVETDLESWELATIMLSLGNGPREGGGFLITPDAKFDDGVLNYVTIGKISRLTMLRLVPEVMKGTHARFKQVRLGTCRKMSLTSRQPLYIHCDGEIFAGFGSDIRKLSLEILPQAIQFIKE